VAKVRSRLNLYPSIMTAMVLMVVSLRRKIY
jgi:hypothetical protein